MELAQFGKVQGRGFYNPIVMTPLAKQSSSVKWFGQATATWDRIQKLLSQVPAHPLPKALWEAGGKHWQGSAEALEQWRSSLLAPPGGPAQEAARKVAHQQWSKARAQEIEQSAASYKLWLQESSQRGMGPIFKAIKTHEAKVDRPFMDKPVTARPFHRLKQWSAVWQVQASEAVPIPGLRDEAIREGNALPPIPGHRLEKYFRRLPRKAHGVAGWSIDMLCQLSKEHCAELCLIFRTVEETGEIPVQWTVSIVAMLAKTPQIERPIALLHVVYKAFVKLRWELVEKWLADVADVMPWDAAVPGRATTDVSLRRIASGEAHRVQGKHHITIFLDISTFYEGIRHEALVADARELGFPMNVLHVAISVYQGPRLAWPTNLSARRLKRALAYLPDAHSPQYCPRSPFGGPWHPLLPLLLLTMPTFGLTISVWMWLTPIQKGPQERP